MDALLRQAQERMGERMRLLSMAGRVLAQLEVIGMSESDRDELIKRFPAHVGDTLSRETINGIAQQVRRFEERVEHLDFDLQPLDNNQASLKIAVPVFQRLANLDREIVEREAQFAKLSAGQSESGPDVLALKSQLDQLKKQRDELTK